LIFKKKYHPTKDLVIIKQDKERKKERNC